MRILTIKQPWAWAVLHGGKDVENRVRNIAGDYRGPVAIHAGAAWDWDIQFPVGDTPHPTSHSLVRGAILGVVDLVDVHDGSSESMHAMDGSVLGTRACSPWAEPNTFHLVLANPRPLRTPIPFKGALGLRRLDADTITRIEAQL